MGYTTNFTGTLQFNLGMSIEQLAHLQTILGEDRRDHPEWNAPDTFYYVDLQISPSLGGLEWSGAEKSYSMDDQVRTVLRLMREKYPDFTLMGKMQAQGESIDDVWTLSVIDGAVTKTSLVVEGIAECPHCRERFVPKVKGETK